MSSSPQNLTPDPSLHQAAEKEARAEKAAVKATYLTLPKP